MCCRFFDTEAECETVDSETVDSETVETSPKIVPVTQHQSLKSLPLRPRVTMKSQPIA